MGWTGTDLTEKTMEVTISSGSYGNRSYTANWQENTYTVIYDANGGAASKLNDTVTYDENIILATAERKGYEFVCWKADGKSYSNGKWKTAKNVTLVAEWKIINYTITYNLDEGTVDGNPVKYTVEDTVTLIAPERTGYTFAGWIGTDLTEATKAVTISKGTIGNKEYTAIWTANTYKVTYNANGGIASKLNDTATYDSEFTLAAAKREGYEFICWKNNDEEFTISKWALTENITLVAEWEIINYTIIYNLDGGNASGNPTTYTIEDEIILKKPLRTGYDFIGWTSIRNSNPIQNLIIEKGSIGHIEYVANWELATFTMTFITNGGDEIQSLNIEYQDSINLPEAKRSGFTFGGWYTASSLEEKYETELMPAVNQTVYAWWKEENKPTDFTYMGSNYITISAYQGTSTAVRIPTYINNAPVTFIGDSAFYENKTIQSVILSEFITSIGQDAFWRCSALKSIEISKNVTTIGAYAFAFCSNLHSVEIPEGVSTINSRTFSECFSLTHITVPSTITMIDSYAFEGCYKLVEIYNKSTSIEIRGRYNGNIGYYAQNIYTQPGNSKITIESDSYIFYNSGTDKYFLSYIGDDDINVSIPSGTTKIYNYAFYEQKNLTEVTIPSTVTSIGTHAFAYSGIMDITIPSSVKTIGDSAFENCDNLMEISLPSGVTRINKNMFYGCNNLNEVTLASSTNYIGKKAFIGCNNLAVINGLNRSYWRAKRYANDYGTQKPYLFNDDLTGKYYSDCWWEKC